MGRHRRATTTATETTAAGRHRGTGRGPAPARTGLLGASAALAMGAVAVSSGLIPGMGDTFVVSDRDGRVQADGPVGLTPRGGGSATPTDRASRGAEREGLPETSTSPSVRASGVPRQRTETASPPPRTSEPTATPSQTGADGTADGGTRAGSGPSEGGDGSGRGGSGGRSGGGSGTEAGSRETTAEARVLTLVNAERAQAGCSPLTADPELAALAGDHSEDMAERDYFSHTTPDGMTPWDRAEAAGVDHMGGENIARGQADAEAVMESWMNSPGHRANILNCDFTTLGVGAHFAPGGPWWTQTFG